MHVMFLPAYPHAARHLSLGACTQRCKDNIVSTWSGGACKRPAAVSHPGCVHACSSQCLQPYIVACSRKPLSGATHSSVALLWEQRHWICHHESGVGYSSVIMPFFLQKRSRRKEAVSPGDSLVVHPVLLEKPMGLPKLQDGER